MTKRFALCILVTFALAASGCARRNSEPEPPDDLAMQWAKYDRKTPEEAAREYFLPTYYYDPTNTERPVPNYFRGMDRIAVAPDGPLDPFRAPVSQLLDKTTPEFTTGDPVATPQEILGRNTWMIWTGGNERFWDWLANNSFGFADVLKLVDSRSRTTRFRDSGLITEPETMQAGAPIQDEFGLWLDLPADEKIRTWRKKYATTTFDQLRRRVHPSQRGQPGYQGERPKKKGDGGYYDDYPYDYPANDPDIPLPDIYGLSSGVVGLRLFPNPGFDEAAQKKWDAEKYYSDPEYFGNPELIRPYRVGMSCAFCHASFHPLKPPRDVTNPGWENISGNIGAQYLRIRSIFGNLLTKDNFIYHVLDSQPPGTIDTSLIASDNINNSNTMNSVFHLPQRALLSFKNPPERLSAASASQPSIWGHPEDYPPAYAYDTVPDDYRKVFEDLGLGKELRESNGNPRYVPRILLDGADSIGAWGALARVYLNIGTYSEQWNRLHRPIVGFDPQKPFTIDDCEQHSVYWHATQLRVGALRDYFLKVTPTMPLLATENGEARATEIDLTKLEERARDDKNEYAKLLARERAGRIDKSKLKLGRKVFAKNCIVCHSSIQPEVKWAAEFAFGAEEVEPLRNGSGESREQVEKLRSEFEELSQRRRDKLAEWERAGEFWDHDPGQWLRDPEYAAWAERIVENEDFWRLNYLSTDFRIPINLVRTNAGRALATNAIDKNMWDDFASESYQTMPSVGPIPFFSCWRCDSAAAPSGKPSG